MNTHEIRKKYLDYFKNLEHKVVPSASLLPENDPTTLFTGSGMQPMVPFLLGQKHPEGTRIVDSQKCFRAQDIEEVGDTSHTTFFEMLGNWSLGDYFKQEQIPWMFGFLTKELQLDARRIYVTCFRGNPELNIPKDEESAELWQKLYKDTGIDAATADNPETQGMQDARIFYYPETKNWWSRAGVPDNMPVGEPGGPDSEMFWDFDPENKLKQHENSVYKDKPCHVNCDCGRFMEIGNNVFMEYIKTKNGFEPLPQKNVDFGGGLERLAAAVQDTPDVFRISVFKPLVDVLEARSGKTYGQAVEDTQSFRVILDHLRAATFLIADGALPSNKDQGYFTRRLIRRAVRFGNKLGIEDNFCADVAQAVITEYKEAYPELTKQHDSILDEMNKEESKFRNTLKQGLKRFAALTKQSKTLNAQDAFLLYQSFGFPKEVMEDLSEEQGISFDGNGFDKEFDAHKDASRAGAEQKFKGGLADDSEMSVKYHTATHLLHASLKKILGEHVEQKGSNITAERMRFDFNHPEKVTPEQIAQLEEMVNGAIQKDYPMSWQEMAPADAKAMGALGYFDEKYAQLEKVKVYSVGNDDMGYFSREICGGPHVEHTGVLGHFKILKEESVSAGVRRIKAVLE